MVCNLADLDDFVNSNILERFGHENLNTLREFQEVVPTTENLCIELYHILERGFRHATIEKVRMEETMLNSFEYAGGRAIRT
jgi:6-pyruvoyltetrahydropterin/6-carboxytetrahydropterin synthase